MRPSFRLPKMPPPKSSSTPSLPLPYKVGDSLQLKASDGGILQVTICHILSVTVSPVIEVRMAGGDGRAVLKLFDRRFGEQRERHPYNQRAEAAWQSCIRSGLAQALLRDLQDFDDAIKKKRFLDANDETDDDDDDEEEESEEQEEEEELGENEVNIFHDFQRLYETEVRAYAQLKPLQGQLIPNFIDSVIYSPPEMPVDLPARYFEVRGILIEYIDGFPLSELTSHVPDQPQVWKKIIKNAVNIAREVNRAGVVHNDCQPRNLLVVNKGHGEFQSYMIDFAQSSLREDYKDTEDLDDYNGYSSVVQRADNHGAVAALMSMRLKRKTSYDLDVNELLE